jgi:hypothetical protein
MMPGTPSLRPFIIRTDVVGDTVSTQTPLTTLTELWYSRLLITPGGGFYSAGSYQQSPGQNYALLRLTDSTNAVACETMSHGIIPAPIVLTDTMLPVVHPAVVPFTFTQMQLNDSSGFSTVKLCDEYTSIVNPASAKAQTQLFPNPVVNILQVKNDIRHETVYWRLVTSTGKTLQSGADSFPQWQMDVSYLHHGIYFLEIRSDDGVEYVKWVK